MSLIIKIFLYSLPFQIFFFNWNNFSFSLTRVLLLALFLPALLKIKEILKSKAIMSWILFLAVTVISFLITERQDWFLRKYIFLLNISAVLPIFYIYIKNSHNSSNVLKALIYAAFAPLTLALFQFCSQFIFAKESIFLFFKKIGPFFWGKGLAEAVINIPSWYVKVGNIDIMRTFFPFPDPHSLAIYINLIFSLLLVSYFVYSIINKKLFYIFLILLLITQALTFSRGGYIIFLIESLLVLFLIKNSKKLISVLIGILIISFLTLPFFSERFLSSFNLSDFSISSRLNLWNKAVELFLHHPIEGIGLGSFPFYMNRFLGYYNPVNVHNSYLEIAVETGIFALLFFILFVCLIFYQAIKNKRYFLLIPLIGFLTHGLFESHIFNTPNLSLFFIICAIILSTEKLTYAR